MRLSARNKLGEGDTWTEKSIEKGTRQTTGPVRRHYELGVRSIIDRSSLDGKIGDC